MFRASSGNGNPWKPEPTCLSDFLEVLENSRKKRLQYKWRSLVKGYLHLHLPPTYEEKLTHTTEAGSLTGLKFNMTTVRPSLTKSGSFWDICRASSSGMFFLYARCIKKTSKLGHMLALFLKAQSNTITDNQLLTKGTTNELNRRTDTVSIFYVLISDSPVTLRQGQSWN